MSQLHDLFWASGEAKSIVLLIAYCAIAQNTASLILASIYCLHKSSWLVLGFWRGQIYCFTNWILRYCAKHSLTYFGYSFTIMGAWLVGMIAIAPLIREDGKWLVLLTRRRTQEPMLLCTKNQMIYGSFYTEEFTMWLNGLKHILVANRFYGTMVERMHLLVCVCVCVSSCVCVSVYVCA